MAYIKLKAGEKLPKSKYKGVTAHNDGKGYIVWWASKTYKKIRKYNTSQTERQAALAYDKILLEFGLEPVNILKRK